MFGLNYHHQPIGVGGNTSMDLSPNSSVDFYNLYDSDFYNSSINGSFPPFRLAGPNISHISTQTLDRMELTTQVGSFYIFVILVVLKHFDIIIVVFKHFDIIIVLLVIFLHFYRHGVLFILICRANFYLKTTDVLRGPY